jgi:hypothetical protein
MRWFSFNHATRRRCWYVNSFCEDGFQARRHECANAAMAVYGLSHARSRELYDLTMLEVRRVLYDDIKPRQPIPAGRLLGTRSAWMARYTPLLTACEFTKFVTLMRELAHIYFLLSIRKTRAIAQIGTRPSAGRT